MKNAAFVIILLLLFTADAAAQYRDRSRVTEGPCRVERGLIILTRFPDIEPPVKKEYARKRFFRELNEYVQEMSYGKVCIKGDVTEKWITLPHPVSKYRISSRNLEVDKDRVRKLIDDALKGLDRDVDVSRYSFVVVFLGAKLRDYGMIGLCGYPGMLGWGSEDVLMTQEGEIIKGGVAIYSFQAHLGTLFHDIAHILGGIRDGKRLVPCLYDHDLQARQGDMRETFVDSAVNMGYWDPMSCHYYKWDIPPPGISSWTKLRLGWMNTDRVRVLDPKKKSAVILNPLEDPEGKTLAIKIQLTESTYYLIENRQPRGFDKNLPGSGVLIMFGDDRVSECRKGKSPVRLMNADPSQEHMAGAAFDLGKNPEFTDRENNLRIRIMSKESDSYKLDIGPY